MTWVHQQYKTYAMHNIPILPTSSTQTPRQ
jgi:hypothetical protein